MAKGKHGGKPNDKANDKTGGKAGKVTVKQAELKSFAGDDGTKYVVFRSKEATFTAFEVTELAGKPVFEKVSAVEAAKNCKAEDKGTSQTMWRSIWDSQEPQPEPAPTPEAPPEPAPAPADPAAPPAPAPEVPPAPPPV